MYFIEIKYFSYSFSSCLLQFTLFPISCEFHGIGNRHNCQLVFMVSVTDMFVNLFFVLVDKQFFLMYDCSQQSLQFHNYLSRRKRQGGLFMNTQTQLRTRTLVIMALFTAVLCVSAYISIPLPSGSHITFLNFIVLLIAFLFPVQQSFVITFVWMLLGAVGVPVFIGANAGISYLIGGWGGYSFGFLLVAIFVPLLRSKEFHRLPYTVLSILAAILIDVTGALWLMIITGISVRQAVLMGIIPFLLLDLVKAVVVVQIVPRFRTILSLF